MNNLETIKQRLIYALDKSDTPKEFLFNVIKEVYKQGYEDGISVTEAWMMEDLENQIKEGKGCLGRDEE